MSDPTPENQQQARNALFDQARNNQKEGLVREIKELNNATSNSLRSFEQLLVLVREADLERTDNWKPQEQKVRSTYDTYNKGLLKAIKSSTGTIKNELRDYCVKQIPGILEDQDDEVIDELGGFLENFSKLSIPTNNRSDSSFEAVLAALGEADKYYESVSRGRPYDAAIKAVKQLIERLEAEKKQVEDEDSTRIPETVAEPKIDDELPQKSKSPKIAELPKGGEVGEDDEAPKGAELPEANEEPKDNETPKESDVAKGGRLPKKSNRLKDLERQIKEEKKELSRLLYKRSLFPKEKPSWQKIDVQLGKVRAEITSLEPKFSSITKVQEALKVDVQRYLDFLSSPDAKDPAKKASEQSNMQHGAKLYQRLVEALETFVTT